MAKKTVGPSGPSNDFASGRDRSYFDVGKDTKKCYHGHPILDINGGKFAGGSCLYPAHEDFDVYVGFDGGMRFSGRHLPWREGDEFMMAITDRGTPRDPEAFDELVGWVWARLGEGRRVHAGCIGGHGRTGLLVAALASKLGAPGPIAWTREHYCDKAIESEQQIAFLAERYGAEADAAPRDRKKGWGGWSGPKGGKDDASNVVEIGPPADDPRFFDH